LVHVFSCHLKKECLNTVIRARRVCLSTIFPSVLSTYEQDVVIDRGEIRKRKKMPSRQFRDAFGHTTLSIEEKIPWKCRRLVIGTGAYGRLPVMKEVELEAERRHLELVIVPTSEAILLIGKESAANAPAENAAYA
jgi:hypothetical protein